MTGLRYNGPGNFPKPNVRGMQDQPNYLGKFAESERADAKFAELVERAVKKQLEPLLERLEEIEKTLKRNE